MHDERLSGDWHKPSLLRIVALNAGGNRWRRKTSIGVGGAVGPINAPTVFNSVFNIRTILGWSCCNPAGQAGGPPLNLLK
ncbi:hypothetical protein KCP77_01910 [Salmonella enterica subsp. enterica]|nr:hypothetical protein KCP77_01910 [Salmonella enterica subsp. enterica]